MTNDELDRLLRASKTPERSDEYGAVFSKDVIREASKTERRSVTDQVSRRFQPGWGLSFALATACIIVAFVFGFWRGKQSHSEQKDVAAIQKYFREIQTLFPNQLQAVVIDAKGPRFVLADSANVPRSTPLIIRVCEGKQCKTVVTFSGQKIQANGDTFDVLLDSKGNVLVVGDDVAWSSADPAPAAPQSLHLEARPLEQL